MPRQVLAAVLLVESLAVVLVTIGVATTPVSVYRAGLAVAVTFVAGGILHAEVSLRIERVRRRVGGETAQIDLTSVWTFAAALILPPAAASAVVALLYLFVYFRVWRPARTPAYRQVFSTSTVVLAAHAAAAAVAYVGFAPGSPISGHLGALAVVAALLAYTVVNSCLVIGAVVLSASRSVREVLDTGDEVVLEVATLCLGALVAVAMTTGGPALVAFVLLPLLVLHRAVLVRQLERAANTDAKTGLLSAAAWHRMAVQRLARARRGNGSAGVLIMDLDYFKNVNDTYGHLAGDVVLRAVATAVRAEVRDAHDLVGRFGGEEFVVLLPRQDAARYEHADLHGVAERIRGSVARLAIPIPTPDGPLTIAGLSISIGGATFPEDGDEVQDLVAVADTALYEAKRNGRNTVRLGWVKGPEQVPKQRVEAENAEPPTGG